MGLLPDVPIIWYLGAGDTHSEWRSHWAFLSHGIACTALELT